MLDYMYAYIILLMIKDTVMLLYHVNKPVPCYLTCVINLFYTMYTVHKVFLYAYIPLLLLLEICILLMNSLVMLVYHFRKMSMFCLCIMLAALGTPLAVT